MSEARVTQLVLEILHSTGTDLRGYFDCEYDLNDSGQRTGYFDSEYFLPAIVPLGTTYFDAEYLLPETSKGKGLEVTFLDVEYDLFVTEGKVGHFDVEYDLPIFKTPTGYLDGEYDLTTFKPETSYLDAEYDLNVTVVSTGYFDAEYSLPGILIPTGYFDAEYDLPIFVDLKGYFDVEYALLALEGTTTYFDAEYDLAIETMFVRHLDVEYDLNVFQMFMGFFDAEYDLFIFQDQTTYIDVEYDLLTFQMQTGFFDAEYDLFANEMFIGYFDAEYFLDATEQYFTWVRNHTSGAVHRYEQFPMHSFARRGQQHLGAAEDGIYLLEGTDDAGTDIAAYSEGGRSLLGTKRLKRVPSGFVAAKTDGDIRITFTLDDDVVSGPYTISPNQFGSNEIQVLRLKGQWGYKSRYWRTRIENVLGSRPSIDGWELEVEPLKSRYK